jgi:deoxyribodipyrimidine photolyase-related protein
MKAAIGQSLDYAYAHHIQRLMVTGNFCLLTEINPDEVDAWYLGIYIDAIEWVEMPNTRGMALYADNGIVATKPYAASGNYINKMGDYCSGCHYNVKQKTGIQSCPFNSLYWRFMHVHEKTLTKNPRIRMIYRSWDQLSDDQRQEVLDRARYCLDNLSSL